MEGSTLEEIPAATDEDLHKPQNGPPNHRQNSRQVTYVDAPLGSTLVIGGVISPKTN
jgi:hypothetical protein